MEKVGLEMGSVTSHFWHKLETKVVLPAPMGPSKQMTVVFKCLSKKSTALSI
jgi:hypothetical protein